MPKAAIVYGPGEGKLLTARGSNMFFKAIGSTTSGACSLMERTLPPGVRKPSFHIHPGNEEAYYILEGSVDIFVGAQTYIVTPHTFLLVPRGVAHTFGNDGTEPARLLVLHTPALDHYFEELQKLWSTPTPPTREQEYEFMQRYGFEPAANLEEKSRRNKAPGT
jgi:uncharacterized cupin superfamily protein